MPIAEWEVQIEGGHKVSVKAVDKDAAMELVRELGENPTEARLISVNKTTKDRVQEVAHIVTTNKRVNDEIKHAGELLTYFVCLVVIGAIVLVLVAVLIKTASSV
jgi:hypothetical protein